MQLHRGPASARWPGLHSPGRTAPLVATATLGAPRPVAPRPVARRPTAQSLPGAGANRLETFGRRAAARVALLTPALLTPVLFGVVLPDYQWALPWWYVVCFTFGMVGGMALPYFEALAAVAQRVAALERQVDALEQWAEARDQGAGIRLKAQAEADEPTQASPFVGQAGSTCVQHPQRKPPLPGSTLSCTVPAARLLSGGAAYTCIP